ncbi:MAG: MFS transporter [Betaproteobacteria bacterium SG8_39]|nr:MAG: MFS transporter [Betaproteobacteria bacterium SG8_39]
MSAKRAHPPSQVESRAAWLRLFTSLALMTIGGSGMYAVVVVLPLVQAEFSVARSVASLPYTLTMVGFGLGGILMGRLADRYGVIVPVLVGAVSLGVGFIAAGAAPGILVFALVQGLIIGFLGSSATFAPLVADTSLWFTRRRGIAVAICISGNYLAGALWPPVLQYFFDHVGWRATFTGVGLFCLVAMLPLALVLRRPAPVLDSSAAAAGLRQGSSMPLGMAPGMLQLWLCVAGVACCVAMSMPQVHIVAYCGDLGFAAARGAEMLSLMLGFGIVSRLASGWISDRIGGLALLLFLPFDGLATLYLISALFGLFQGGIVPSYAIIVREYFTPLEAGRRVGTVLMATLFGMALGGWLSGAIFDLTGSYHAAFVNGIAWNLVNIAIVVALLRRAGGLRITSSSAPAAAAAARRAT